VFKDDELSVMNTCLSQLDFMTNFQSRFLLMRCGCAINWDFFGGRVALLCIMSVSVSVVNLCSAESYYGISSALR